MTVDGVPIGRGADRLGFLLARHGAIADVRMRQALGASGLKHRAGVVLLYLAESGRMSQRALIEALGVDPSVLVAILNDLERDGLIERRRDPNDRRRHIVEITPAGAAMLARMEEAIATVERELFADLDADELARLHALLSRVATRPDDPICAGE